MKLPVLLKREVPSPEDTPPKSGSSPWKKRLLRKRVLIPAVACVVALSLGIHFFGGGQTALAADLTYTTAAVERRDITAEITGSGSLEAANSYSVTSLVDGTILADYFEEGDQVNEDTVLYDIDSSDMASSLEQSEISLSQAQRSYNNKLKDLADLTVTAPKAGQVVDIAVEAGDDVSAGQTVATIRDSDTMTLKVPFLADEAAGFYVGQSAQVTLDSTFEVLNGTVTEVSGVDQVLTGNVIVRDVTIQVSNPGGLSTSQTGSATVDGCASASGGSFSYLAERSVTAEVSGTVASIHVSEGDRLSQGGDDQKYVFPEVHVHDAPLDLSFSGLKTAAVNLVHNARQKGETLDLPSLAASFAAAVSGTLVPRVMEAARRCGYGKIAVAGGVAANSRIRGDLERACAKSGDRLYLPPLSLCGDNGAMIGCQAYYEYLAGHTADVDLNAYANLEIGMG